MYKELEYPIFQIQYYGKICGPIKNITVGEKITFTKCVGIAFGNRQFDRMCLKLLTPRLIEARCVSAYICGGRGGDAGGRKE